MSSLVEESAQLRTAKASTMLKLPLGALLIMPLALFALCARAQMVPVAPDSDSASSALATSPGQLYTTSPEAAPEHPLDDHATGDTVPRALAGIPPPVVLAPAATKVTAGPLHAIRSSELASEPGVGAGDPTTLPPRAAKVRDLPALQHGDKPRIRPFQAAALGLTASSLGAGAELAVPIARTLNLRVGGSYLRWSYPFDLDGIGYSPGVKFTSGRGTIDWFPHHGAFHISAGALYFRNKIAGSADVTEGGRFSLGGTNYTNSVDDPIHGTAAITYARQFAPIVLLGFGNVLPRSGRHLSMPFEFGGAYLQPPTLALKLAGTACTNQGCFNAATDPQIRGNLAKEVATLQSDIRFLQVYPIVSLGLACRF